MEDEWIKLPEEIDDVSDNEEKIKFLEDLILERDINIAVDVFSGTGSATKFFRESDDWVVLDVELNPENDFDSERIDFEMDVRDFNPKVLDPIKENIRFVWASPPCNSFSLAGGGSWSKENERLRMPNQEKAVKGIHLVYRAMYIIQYLNPEHWFMENPRGGLRAIIGEPQYSDRRLFDKKEKVKDQKDRHYPGSVTYCQYGDDRMKPTDLWGDHPQNMSYDFCGNGMDCHQPAPRGSDTGTQGREKNDRWKIPEGLAEEVFQKTDESIKRSDREEQ